MAYQLFLQIPKITYEFHGVMTVLFGILRIKIKHS